VVTANVRKPYAIHKVGEAEVLEAVKKEHDSVLLVYANDNALNFQGSELNVALKHFAARDNQAFAEELEQEEGGPPSSGDRPTEIDFEDIPLIDRNGSSSSVRELTPMSTSSPGRDEDGQPSPKRPRGDDPLLEPERLPSYEESLKRQEMQERKGNKIGLYAEQMLVKYGSESEDNSEKGEKDAAFMHVEHSS
jgi:hypothetical protein